MKANSETREKLGQSARRSCRVRPSTKSGFSGLPGFVEDCGQMCFSGGRLPLFFLHVRVLRGALAFGRL
jgi:hypothetical protein